MRYEAVTEEEGDDVSYGRTLTADCGSSHTKTGLQANALSTLRERRC